MAKTRQKSTQTIGAILDAAGRVIRRSGSAGLTIDAVAAEAELSKGGVLHHFASKDALIAALVNHELGLMEVALSQVEARLPPSRAAPLRATIEHARGEYLEGGFPPALLAASVESPAALEGYRSLLKSTLSRLQSEAGGLDESVVLFFAMMGLFLTKGLGFYAFEGPQARQFLDVIAAMAERLATRNDEDA
jgi:AcrR family transcriptional regulator